jgi:hypothetical protein
VTPVVRRLNGALTDSVSSRAEGAVVSDAQGRYSFPQDRLESGAYSIRVRATGRSWRDLDPLTSTPA